MIFLSAESTFSTPDYSYAVFFIVAVFPRFVKGLKQSAADLFEIFDALIDDLCRHAEVLGKAFAAEIFLRFSVDESSINGDLIAF